VKPSIDFAEVARKRGRVKLLQTDYLRNTTNTSNFDLVRIQQMLFGVPSSRMLRRVTLVRTEAKNRSMCLSLVTTNVVSTLPILVTLMMEALRASETSVLTRSTRSNVPEGRILHSHHHENCKV
jgi:hypothetical protein